MKMVLFILKKVIYIAVAVITVATIASGLSLYKPSVSLSNVRDLDEQIRLAYKPEMEEPLRPGRFLVDANDDDDFIRENRKVKFPKLQYSTNL